MTTTRITVKKPENPFASVLDAKRKRFAQKWGVELVGSNDTRLSQPIPGPVVGGESGGKSLEEIADGLRALADKMSKLELEVRK